MVVELFLGDIPDKLHLLENLRLCEEERGEGFEEELWWRNDEAVIAVLEVFDGGNELAVLIEEENDRVGEGETPSQELLEVLYLYVRTLLLCGVEFI